MRHGEVEDQVTAPSGVLQVVEDLNVTAFLPILSAGGDAMLRPNPVLPTLFVFVIFFKKQT